MKRPRPVLVYMAISAGLTAFLGFAGLGELLSREAIAWIALIAAVVTAMGGVLVQGTVTPLAAPRDAEGNRLVPMDAYQAIPSAPPASPATTSNPAATNRPPLFD